MFIESPSFPLFRYRATPFSLASFSARFGPGGVPLKLPPSPGARPCEPQQPKMFLQRTTRRCVSRLMPAAAAHRAALRGAVPCSACSWDLALPETDPGFSVIRGRKCFWSGEFDAPKGRFTKRSRRREEDVRKRISSTSRVRLLTSAATAS